MTFLHTTNQLKNTYYILRHGHSWANSRQIILSDLCDGQLDEFTLTPMGEYQVRTATEILKAFGEFDSETIIVSSPFSRCRRSAEIVKEILGTADITFNENLRERWFGDWERMSNVHYDDVWVDDRTDPDHTNNNVESASSVQERTASVIEDLERQYEGKTILLVSHGDALQIMQTGFFKQSPSVHRDLKHFVTGEIRKLELQTT